MRILFINNNGAGFADHLTIEEGTTVQQLFADKIKGSPESYLIRVNRQPVTQDQQLREDDRVSVTPVKIDGAL